MSDFNARKAIYDQIEGVRNSRVIAYVTGDRPGAETQVSPEIVDLFVDHLDAVWPASKISLILYTNGGDTAAAWRLINLIRTFCDELEVIVPVKALSAGTLICLGADRIVMTKQATLGPIDPSLNSPLGPLIPGGVANHRAPVSVEAIQGYLDVALNELKITDGQALAAIWTNLSEKIHPLVLGQIFRTRQQIRTLARKLLEFQKTDADVADRIVSFLCSDSGSHDHTINRREARGLGLEIENPDQAFYDILKSLQHLYVEGLELRQPFNPDTLLAGQPQTNYSVSRALIESSSFGSHAFISEGTLSQVQVPAAPGQPAQVGYSDQRRFDGWRKVV